MFRETDLIIGVDIHRKDNVVQMMNGIGQPIGRGSFPNHRQGASALIETIAAAMDKHGCDRAHLGSEATGIYWLPLFCQLEQDAPFDLTQYSFNPRLISDFRDGVGQQDKTDVIDAEMIAERLRFGKRLPRPFKMDEQYLALRTLTRHRFHLANQLTRLKNYTHGHIFLKATTYALSDEKPFSDLFGATSQAVLREFESLDTLTAMSIDQLAAWLDKRGRGRFVDPESNARKLQQVADDSFRLPDDFAAAVHDILALNLRHIRAIEDLIKRLDQRIARQMTPLESPLNTIPGIGPVFSAGILAELGDLSRFDFKEARVASYAGLKWPRSQSANSDFQKSLSRHSNRYLRYYLCQAAQSVRMRVPEYRDYYNRKFKEARSHHHKRAIVLTARKLVRLVVRLLTDNQPFKLKEPAKPN